MLTPLSILSLDQGPKWRESAAETKTPEVAPGRVWDFLRAAAARLAVSLRPAPSRYRA